jgi:hypothetical protein
MVCSITAEPANLKRIADGSPATRKLAGSKTGGKGCAIQAEIVVVLPSNGDVTTRYAEPFYRAG